LHLHKPTRTGTNIHGHQSKRWQQDVLENSPNILADLNQFSALYIKVHGCVWSEYGLGNSFDDDGENHDGDGTWYMTRVQTFRANAAFSLYGTLREDGAFFGGGCREEDLH
jgi:hypothetical protein